MEQTWWITLLVAVIASAPGIIALFIGKRKEKADIASTITLAASELIDDLRQEVAILRTRIEKYETDIDELRCTVVLQAKQIVTLQDTVGRQALRIDEQEKEIAALTGENMALRGKLNGLSTPCE